MSNKYFKKLSVIKLSTNFREATKIVEQPLIPPNDDQVLVKVVYAGVNASDIIITSGRYVSVGKVPYDIGYEALGTIEEVGKSVTGLKVGQPVIVFPFIFAPRAYSEYLYAKSDEIFPVPALRPEFISLFTSGLTVTIGLDQSGHIQKGDKVLITAAAGGLGHIGVQWAKQKGCHVIGTTSSAEKAKVLKELGCDRAINYSEESIDEVLTKEYPNGVDVVCETIGGEVLETLFKHLAKRGRLVMIGAISGYKTIGFPEVSIPNITGQLLFGSKSLIGFGLSDFKELFKEYSSELIAKILKNELKVISDFGENTSEGEFKGIESVVRGVEHLYSGRSIGKVTIKIQD